MDRAEILDAAKRCVCGERELDYGTPENSFKVIGALWEIYIMERCAGTDVQVCIVPEDVAAMLALLKIARIATGHGKDDNWIDLAGYAACGGELQSTGGYIEQEPLERMVCESDRGICPGGCVKNYAEPWEHCEGCTLGGKRDA